jgi:hypothetical protein
MNTNSGEKLGNEMPRWLIAVLPIISAVLGGVALWYTWFRYTEMIGQSGFYWYEWVRPALIAGVGILFMVATLLFLLSKSSGWSVFKLGLSMIPLILLLNLIVLILFRVIPSVVQGNAIPFIAKLYEQPHNKVLLGIAIVVILLSVVKGVINNKK